MLRRQSCALIVAFIFTASSPVAAHLIASSARQSASGSLKLLAYYEGVSKQDLTFDINGSAVCAAGSGQVAFPCSTGGTVSAEGSGNAGLLKLVWQPWERFQYYATIGSGDYNISVPSSTIVNKMTGDGLGIIYGVGMSASVVPDTIVTPAISLDASLTRSQYKFYRIFPGGTPGVDGNIDQRLTLMTYQVAVETSHLFLINDYFKFEPYGGMKWVHVDADLKNLVDGGHSGGANDTLTPFLGLRVPADEHQAFFAEAAFVGGLRYGGGIELRFK